MRKKTQKFTIQVNKEVKQKGCKVAQLCGLLFLEGVSGRGGDRGAGEECGERWVGVWPATLLHGETVRCSPWGIAPDEAVTP